jgi:predicted O-methyltransferase YrrM
MEKKVPNFWASEGYEHRIKQCNQVINSLNNKFNFDKLITIETGSSADYGDGLFGILLGYVTKKTNGKMYSVDISSSVVENSKKIFNEVLPDLDYECVIEDSVTYLKNFKETPNLVHLDSYDLDLLNPLPSMLHHWLEFEAIQDKMPSGSLLLIDDNFLVATTSVCSSDKSLYKLVILAIFGE